MKHVSDGDLHAYLDGALDLYPEGEAEWVRGHIEACRACDERLHDERILREAATSVLEVAGPGSVDAPPFEELRRRAEAPVPRAEDRTARFARLKAMGWAASVVLALGLGWAVGQRPVAPAPGGRLVEPTTTPGRAVAARETDGPAGPSEQEVAVAPEEEASGTRLASGVTPEEPRDVAEGGDAAEPASSAAVASPDDAPRDVVAVGASEPPAGAAQTALGDLARRRTIPAVERGLPGVATPDSAVATRRAQAPPMPPVAGAEERARGLPGRELVAGLPDSTAAADPDSARTPGQQRADARLRLGVEGSPVAPRLLQAVRMRQSPPQPAGAAPEAPPDSPRVFTRATVDAPGALQIPDLEVVRLEWAEVAPGTTGVRVVQRLPGDTATVEILFGDPGRVAADRASGAPATPNEDILALVPASLLGEDLPDGVNQAVGVVGRSWVVIRGRLPENGLRRLLDLIY